MAITALIAASDVVTIVFPNSALSTDWIKTDVIKECQYQYFHDFLGEDYYNELLTQKGTSFTAANQTVYDDYLKKSLAYYVAAQCIPQLHTRVTNLGVIKNYDERSMTADRKEVETLRNDFLASAHTWREQLKNYIEHEDNDQNYSTYHNNLPTETNSSQPAAAANMFFKRSAYTCPSDCSGCDGDCDCTNCCNR